MVNNTDYNKNVMGHFRNPRNMGETRFARDWVFERFACRYSVTCATGGHNE